MLYPSPFLTTCSNVHICVIYTKNMFSYDKNDISFLIHADDVQRIIC